MDYEQIEAVALDLLAKLNSGELKKSEVLPCFEEIKRVAGNEFYLVNEDGTYYLMEDGEEI